MAISVTTAHDGDAGELAAVAAATFPLACPDGVPAEDIAAFITAHLSEERFREYIAAADRAVLTVAAEGRIVGYALLVRGSDGVELSTMDGVELSTMDGVELSKMYVLPGHHGTGAATVLMRSAIDWAAGRGAESVWLGVNRKNDRAQRFYRKHGFEITGTRTFQLGDRTEHDYLMARRL